MSPSPNMLFEFMVFILIPLYNISCLFDKDLFKSEDVHISEESNAIHLKYVPLVQISLVSSINTMTSFEIFPRVS